MDPTIATILGALLGAFLTGPTTYYFTKKLLHLQEFNKAATLFRNSFVDEIDFLKYYGDSKHFIDDTAYGVINSAFSKHRRAYESFRLDLSKKNRVAFDKTWEEYLYPEGNKENCPGPFVDYLEGDESKKRKLAHGKICALLKFTELG